MSSSCHFLELPPELVVRILSYLPSHDLIVCRHTHPFLASVVDSSVLLQYIIELAVAGAEDNPSCTLVVGDRLRALKAHERAWQRLDFARTTVIPIQHNSSSIYDLTGGVFLLGETTDPTTHRTDALNLIRLPSSSDLQEQTLASSPLPNAWTRIDIQTKLIDVGLSVQEHDLIAVVTYSFPSVNPLTGVLQLAFDVHLLKLSTGKPHPLAAKPVIRISEVASTAGLCSVSVEIVGRIMGIMLNFPIPWAEQPSEFYVMDWMTGNVLMHRHSDPRTYNAFAFLSPDVIVLPNGRENVLELCRLRTTPSDDAQEPQPLKTSCTLGLPQLSPHSSIYRLLCRSEPNPHMQAPSNGKPFNPDPAEAIAIFNFFLRNHRAHGALECFSLFVHRSSLLALVPSESASPALDADAASPPIPWNTWGPAVTRWFAPNGLTNRWITTTCGQRHAVIGQDDAEQGETLAPITVFDFNQQNVRRFVAKNGNSVVVDPETEVDIEVVRVSSEVSNMLFAERIESGLPYLKITTHRGFDYESVLLDEERVIGLKLDQDDSISQLCVHSIRIG